MQGRNRDTDVETDLWTQEGKGWWARFREKHWHTYTSLCKIDSSWDAVVAQGSPPGVCDDLEGWEGSSRERG